MNDKTTENGNGATPTPAEIQEKIQAAAMPQANNLNPDAPAHYIKTRELMTIVQFIGSNIVFDQAAPLLAMLQNGVRPLNELPEEPAPDG